MTLQALVNRTASESPTDLAERYEGAMLGLAAGNLLGVPDEGKQRAHLAQRYPDGLREINPSLSAGPWDDDLAQAIVIAEAILEDGGLAAETLAPRFLRWQAENGSGIGRLTASVLYELRRATPPADAARLVWEQSGRNSAGNGAVMRCAPVALRWRRDGDALVDAAHKSAIITHFDPRCRWSTAVTLTAICAALSGRSLDLAELSAAAESSGAPADVMNAIHEIADHELSEISLDGRDQGYTLKAMQVGLWCNRQPDYFEDALVQVVMQGGDTDTNGAVAGSVMGARVGVNGIPQRWRALIPGRARISELASALHHAAG